MRLDILDNLWNKIGPKKIGSLCKKIQFEAFYFTFFLLKLTNFDKAYLPQFLRYGGVLGLFGNLTVSSASHFGSFFPFEDFILMISALTKNCFWLNFKKDL